MEKFLRKYYNPPVVIERGATLDESGRQALRLFLWALLAFGLLLLHLGLRVAVTTTSYDLRRLDADYRRASSEHGYLLRELSQRADWKRIEQAARRDYGFVDSYLAREIALPAAEPRVRFWRRRRGPAADATPAPTAAPATGHAKQAR